MRHVVQTSEVPHLWANRAQSEARNSHGTLYFNGDVIYSYGSHFPIARHVVHKERRAVLLTTRTYSVTTAQHISMTWRACSHAPVFHVPDVRANRASEHAANMADYASRITQRLANAARARAWKESYYQSAVELHDAAIAYAAFFGVRLRSGLLPIVPPLDVVTLTAWRAAEAARVKKAQAAAVRANAKWITAWRAGASVGSNSQLPIMLRCFTAMCSAADSDIDPGCVETSWGARVSLKAAKLGLAMVRQVRESGVSYTDPEGVVKLGPYPLTSIAVDGTLTAGCHVIVWAEIERVAPVLDGVILCQPE